VLNRQQENKLKTFLFNGCTDSPTFAVEAAALPDVHKPEVLQCWIVQAHHGAHF